jgi:flagellar FliL protein
MSDTPTSAPAPAAAPKKSRRGLFIIAAVLLLLAGGGGGAYWMLVVRAAEPAAEAKPEKAEPTPAAIVPLDAFVVNLADPGGMRYLRVTLSLVTADEERAKTLGEDEVTRARIRSAILELLAQQTSDTLVTPDGKTTLKKAIAARVSQAVPGLQVSDVLFSEFVVQF